MTKRELVEALALFPDDTPIVLADGVDAVAIYDNMAGVIVITDADEE